MIKKVTLFAVALACMFSTTAQTKDGGIDAKMLDKLRG